MALRRGPMTTKGRLRWQFGAFSYSYGVSQQSPTAFEFDSLRRGHGVREWLREKNGDIGFGRAPVSTV
jgi:hypothetical protein